VEGHPHRLDRPQFGGSVNVNDFESRNEFFPKFSFLIFFRFRSPLRDSLLCSIASGVASYDRFC